MLGMPFLISKDPLLLGAWTFALMSGNIFSIKRLSDSLIAMPESSCNLHRFSGGIRMLSGSSAIGRSPLPNLRRHRSKCCTDWPWPILMFLQRLKTVKIHKSGLFFIRSAVMWALEPLWVPI